MTRKRKPQARRERLGRTEKAKTRPARTATGHRAPRPSSLSAVELKIRADVLAAHSDMMRDPNLSASRAARDNGITIRDLWKYIPRAFKKDSSGRIHAIADQYVRRMEIPGPEGPIVVKIKGYKAKSEVARFRNDVFRFLGGDRSALEKWKGIRIQGHELLTDPRIIRLLGEQGNLPEHFGSEQVIPYSGGPA
jgi:hypothetical protein